MKRRTSAAESPGSSDPGWWFALVLLFGTFLAYQPIWHAGFIWDDDVHITLNPLLITADGWKRIWFSREAPQFYPLVFSLFRLEFGLWGTNPVGYHLDNILLHAVSSCLLWRVLRRLHLPGAWFAAALFALHPVNVESVAWVSERKNTLCMVFFLLSVLCLIRSQEEVAGSTARRDEVHAGGSTTNWRWYTMSVFLFICALLSKTAVAPWPVAMLGFVWWRKGKITWRDVLLTVPLFAAAGAQSLLTIWFEHLKTESPDVMHAAPNIWLQLAGAARALWFYVYKAILPFNLKLIYPAWGIGAGSPVFYLPLIVAVLAVILIWRNKARLGRGAVFGCVYFLLMLLPVLGFMHIGYLDFAPVADHWQYFAIIAPIAFVSAIWFNEKSKQWLMSRIAVLSGARAMDRLHSIFIPSGLLIVFAALTAFQSAKFVDAKAYWKTVLSENPAATVAYYQLGLIIEVEGNLDEAINLYREALRRETESAVLPGAGSAELRAKRMQTETALRLLSNALLKQGKEDEAREHLTAALRLDPNLPEAHNNLSNILAKEHDAEGALFHSLAAVRLRPDWQEPYFNAGNAYFLQSNYSEAVTQYSQALKLKPDYAEACQNLAFVLEKSGRDSDAARQYERLLQLRPEFVVAYHRLSQVLARLGEFEKATKVAERGFQIASTSGQDSLAAQIHENLLRFREKQLPVPKR